MTLDAAVVINTRRALAVAPLHLPGISADQCLDSPSYRPPIDGSVYCTRAYGHTGRHAATRGAGRAVIWVWASDPVTTHP